MATVALFRALVRPCLRAGDQEPFRALASACGGRLRPRQRLGALWEGEGGRAVGAVRCGEARRPLRGQRVLDSSWAQRS